MKALLVEDNPGDARLLRELLVEASTEDIQLVHVERLAEAIQHLCHETFDVMLLDLSLPDSRGLETFAKVRNWAKNTPIVVLTGLHDDELAVNAVQAGAQDYLVKGQVTGDLLLRAMRYAIERQHTQTALRASIDDLERRVAERTAALQETNDQLKQQLELRRIAETQIQSQLQHLEALRTIDMAIISSFDLRMTLHVLLEQLNVQLRVDASDVLLYNSHLQQLEYASSQGWRAPHLQQGRLRLDDDYAGRAVTMRHIVHLPDIAQANPPFLRAGQLAREQFVGYYGVPLIVKGQVKGVLEVFHRSPLPPDTDREEFLENLATQAAIAIDNAELFEEIQRSHSELVLAYESTLEGWARALDLHMRENAGSTQRIVNMTLRLGRARGIDENELVHVRRGALLHDIGKIAISDSILLKPGPLIDEEWAEVRKHPLYAHQLLHPIAYLRPALDIPFYHHERWDGSGYPHGLQGETIPLAARVFAVVDAWDALRSKRPFRAGWPEEKVRDHLKAQAGKQFDPACVEIFLNDIAEAGAAAEAASSFIDSDVPPVATTTS